MKKVRCKVSGSELVTTTFSKDKMDSKLSGFRSTEMFSFKSCNVRSGRDEDPNGEEPPDKTGRGDHDCENAVLPEDTAGTTQRRRERRW